MHGKLAISSVLIAAVVCFHPPAHALALADIKVKSSLNQPFEAIIEIISAQADELDSLHTSILRPSGRLPGIYQWPKIRVDLVRVGEDRGYLRITSAEAIREPILEFLLDLAWSRGRMQREYSLLINPP